MHYILQVIDKAIYIVHAFNLPSTPLLGYRREKSFFMHKLTHCHFQEADLAHCEKVHFPPI